MPVLLRILPNSYVLTCPLHYLLHKDTAQLSIRSSSRYRKQRLSAQRRLPNLTHRKMAEGQVNPQCTHQILEQRSEKKVAKSVRRA
jgi:hypothetical protein